MENGAVNQEALILTHTESRIKTAMEISTTRSGLAYATGVHG